MKKLPFLLMGVLAVAGITQGQTTVTTDPVGFVTVTVPAQSDAVLAVPLFRSSVFQGTISSISGTQVTLNATPTLPAGSTYALMLASGTKEGMVAKVTAQSGAILTVQLDAGDDFSGVVTGASGEAVTIMPYWTPGTLLPSTVAAGTQILGFQAAGTGTNLSSAQIYVHGGGGAWEDGISGDDATNAILPFGSGFVLRNSSASPLVVSLTGSVPMTKHRVKLATLAGNTPQDIVFGYSSPILETLNSVGLGAAADGDQILGFNNAATGYNKSATQLLIMDGGVWTDQISGDPVGGTFQFTPGYGYIFRKAGTANPTVTVWSDLPSYLQ